MIYLDNNATTELLEEPRAAMLEALQGSWANPSAGYAAGRATRREIEGARAQVASLVSTEPDNVTFVSGGSEANSLALVGAFLPRRAQRPVIVIGASEHPSVTETAHYLEKRHGAQLRVVGVDGEGRVDLEALDRLVDEHTAVVSVMLANNLTGVITDLAAVARLARPRGVLVHTDAVQAPGKLAVELDRLEVDLLSISAHKLHGPKGAGALLRRGETELDPLVHGGGQERGLRSGTEDVAGILGFGAAAALAARDLDQITEVMRALRDRLEAGLLASDPSAVIRGARAPRLVNTSCVTFPGVDGEALLAALDVAGVAASASSACHTGASGPAPALLALGLSPLDAQATLRFSLSRLTTEAEIDAAIAHIDSALAAQRSPAGGRRQAATHAPSGAGR